jgi:hypothetical protein
MKGWDNIQLNDLGFESRQEMGIFLLTASRSALGPIQPPIQWVPGAFSLGIKRLGREADRSPPSSTKVKNAWSYTSTPNTPSWRGAQLKHRNIFNFRTDYGIYNEAHRYQIKDGTI